MKKVEMYETEDGTLFESFEKAQQQSYLLKEVKKLIELIGGFPNDSGCQFINGGGYYQLSCKAVEEFDSKAIAIIKKSEPWIFKGALEKEGLSNETLMKSYGVGRCLCDSDSVLYTLVSIRNCIDSKYRRWGQPYFANNPDKGEQKKLN